MLDSLITNPNMGRAAEKVAEAYYIHSVGEVFVGIIAAIVMLFMIKKMF